jgi:DNA-binding response OmpR family regulator
MSKRVLLCDDEVHILRAAEIKLKRAGLDVRCASDGEEGWTEIERECPDLLVTDCQMPYLDGFGLVERVRNHQATKHLPVIMLTAKGFEIGHRTATSRWGIIAILSKPFSPRELLRCVNEVLETGKLELPPVMA